MAHGHCEQASGDALVLLGGEPGGLLPNVSEAPAAEIAEFLGREGTAIRVGKDRYYTRVHLEEAVGKVLAEVQARGKATPSELRSALGLTRKYLIPILEWMDAQGLTVRDGDARRATPV